MLIKEQDVLVKRLELKTPVTFTHEHAISKVIFSVRSTGQKASQEEREEDEMSSPEPMNIIE